MAPVFKVLLDFLRIIRFAKDYIKRFPGRGVSLLNLLGRKLIAWWRFWFGKFGRPKPIERSSRETQASSHSVSGGSAVVREYVVAGSYVPPSASHPSLHEQAERHPTAVTHTVGAHSHPPVPDSLSVDIPHAHNTQHPLGGRTNRSSGNLSALSFQSRASADRFSIITNSRDSLRATHGQPSRLPRGTHRQFGRGPDPSRSRERATRPTTPTTRPHTPIHTPRLEIITSNTPFSLHEDIKVNPIIQPPASSSYTHEPLSPPTMSEIRRRQSSTSVVVDIQNPSTDSLPISTSTNLPQITDEPFNIDSPTVRSSPDSPTVHSSPDSPAVDQPDEPGSPTSSSHPTVNYFIPDGRFVQLINSDQIPRYEKHATM
jgi:hypothetical protein